MDVVTKVKTPKRMIYWLGFVLFIPSLILNIFLLIKPKTGTKGVRVMEVIDGDTLLLEGKVKLRLRHVDAPELEFCGGTQARDYLIKLAKGKEIIVSEQIPDQYGRGMILAFTADNVFINLEMVKSGWVRYHSDNSSQEEIIKEAAEKIRKEEKGIFSPLCYQTENTNNPKCNIKGNIDKNSADRKYYYPGCAQYNFTVVEKDLGEDWFCTEEEARKAGFTKAETCR